MSDPFTKNVFPRIKIPESNHIFLLIFVQVQNFWWQFSPEENYTVRFYADIIKNYALPFPYHRITATTYLHNHPLSNDQHFHSIGCVIFTGINCLFKPCAYSHDHVHLLLVSSLNRKKTVEITNWHLFLYLNISAYELFV